MEQEYKYMVATRCFTFNHAPYIEDAMNGFAMQETSFPVITIIVDDASTDGEPEVIRNYLAEHFKLPYRTEETEYAHIICAKHKTNDNCEFVVFFLKYNHYSIKKSKSPYLSEWLDNAKYHALCEGDDYWTDQLKLQKQVEFLDENPDYSMCFTNVQDYSQSLGKFVGSPIGNYDNTKMPVDKKELFYYIMLGGCRIQTLTVLYRNAFLGKFEKNKRNFKMGDTPRWLDLSQIGPIKYISDCTGVYRISVGSACRNPDTLLSFQLSMFDMRIYYCEKYGYEIPKNIKKKYNRSLLNCYMNTDYDISDAPYPPFPMNSIQECVFKKAKSNRLLKSLINVMWILENRLY